MKPNTRNLYYLKKTYNQTFAYKQRDETYFHDSYTLSNIKVALSNHYREDIVDHFVHALKVGTEIAVSTKCRGEYL
jgi:hypothetical protein